MFFTTSLTAKTTTTTTTAAPVRPTQRESARFYHPMPSNPRLIARSSTDVYDKNDVFGKTGRSPRRHWQAAETTSQLYRLWNTDPNRSLRKQIHKELGSVRLVSIKLDECGWERGHLTPVLKVKVEKNSLEWEEGVKVALGCKAVMDHFGLENAHCEVLQSTT